VEKARAIIVMPDNVNIDLEICIFVLPPL